MLTKEIKNLKKESVKRMYELINLRFTHKEAAKIVQEEYNKQLPKEKHVSEGAILKRFQRTLKKNISINDLKNDCYKLRKSNRSLNKRIDNLEKELSEFKKESTCRFNALEIAIQVLNNETDSKYIVDDFLKV